MSDLARLGIVWGASWIIWTMCSIAYIVQMKELVLKQVGLYIVGSLLAPLSVFTIVYYFISGFYDKHLSKINGNTVIWRKKKVSTE